jgi:transposase
MELFGALSAPRQEEHVSYRIAGIDVHKRMLAVVVADVSVEGEYQFERRQSGCSPDQLRALAEWMVGMDVQEVVMESTAQYWKPVWQTLERHWKPACRKRSDVNPMSGKLHLAQAQTNRAPRGRKNDFADAERLLKRLVAQELSLSFVPEVEQRLWRTLTRRKQQLTGDRARLQNRLEGLLEEAHIKLSSVVSDLLGASARRMLAAIADGETDPAVLAAMAHQRLHAAQQELRDALGAATELNPVYRRLVKMAIEELQSIERQMEQLDQEIANLLKPYEETVQRLAEVPGLGVDSAHQIIAEIGATAATFPSEKHLASWVGVCPGEQESAGVSTSNRSPNGNRNMRRLLSQCANAAVKRKGSIFEQVYRRLLPRTGHSKAIWAIAHRICRLIWKILHQGIRYEERGPAVSQKSTQKRTARMIRELRSLGYRVEALTSN